MVFLSAYFKLVIVKPIRNKINNLYKQLPEILHNEEKKR